MENPPASTVAFAELAPHSIQLAVLAGKKLVAVRAFSLDAKADIASFVAEHKLTGVVRATVIGGHNFIHRSGEAESGAVRQPAALQAHASKLSNGFAGGVTAVAVDAATGASPDAARVTPWVLASVDSVSLAAARETLSALGLTPADVTVAATAHFGALVGSLSAGETGLVVVPGEDDAQLVWVTNEGVQSVAPAPVGFAFIYEAVQKGLGLKFKAAAGKLFYNESYDFSEVASKIIEPLAAALAPALVNQPATHFHFVGLVPSQAWLSDGVAKALKLRSGVPTSESVASRLGLTTTGVGISSGSFGLLLAAAAGASDAPWVQATLESRAARPKTAVPFPAKAPGESQIPASPHRPTANVVKPGLKTPVARAAGEASPVVAVSVGESSNSGSAPAKSNKGPIIIAGTVGLVVAVVGMAMHFRSPAPRSEPIPAKPEAPAAPAVIPPVTTPVPAVTPKSVPVATPVPVPVPPPAPVAAALPSAANGFDRFADNTRKFGNAQYVFEVTDKGVIQALSNSKDEVLVESAAGISLQGSYVGTDGRRKWFNVGGIDDSSYVAKVTKSVKEGAVVFDVKVTHPRFEVQQSFRCLEGSIKVSTRFTPINLRDPRGVIAAVHSVRLSPVALNPSARMRAGSDVFEYSMKSGALKVSFDSSVWGRDGADGRQTIIAGENGVAFHFTETNDANRNVLKYDITMP